jgi:hypothetical protein
MPCKPSRRTFTGWAILVLPAGFRAGIYLKRIAWPQVARIPPDSRHGVPGFRADQGFWLMDPGIWGLTGRSAPCRSQHAFKRQAVETPRFETLTRKQNGIFKVKTPSPCR